MAATGETAMAASVEQIKEENVPEENGEASIKSSKELIEGKTNGIATKTEPASVATSTTGENADLETTLKR
jgi:hypothetical protein